MTGRTNGHLPDHCFMLSNSTGSISCGFVVEQFVAPNPDYLAVLTSLLSNLLIWKTSGTAGTAEHPSCCRMTKNDHCSNYRQVDGQDFKLLAANLLSTVQRKTARRWVCSECCMYLLLKSSDVLSVDSFMHVELSLGVRLSRLQSPRHLHLGLRCHCP